MANNKMNKNEEKEKTKEEITWKKSIDFVFNMVGLLVGLGNVWRFPYLCYKNGGGSFLVAYWIVLILVLFPIIVFESAMGQLTGVSAVKSWNLIPLFKGIGYAYPLFMVYSNLYYPVLLTWALRWLVASFSADMPWTNCDNSWNSNSCFPIDVTNASFKHALNSTSYVSSVEEFWRDNILGMTSGIEDIGGLKLDLALCLIAIWVMVYFSVWKGIGWTSKIVYVTATLPIALLLVVVVRGVTLDGAGEGVKRFLIPNVTKLGQFQVWADATSQVLYSFGACTGCTLALSSYNKYHHNVFRDCIIFALANAGASFLAGFAIFSVLGYLAHIQGTSIDEVADYGPGLVFVAYPTALSFMPLPQFWMALFFLVILFLGFDSLFVYFEALIACYRDIFPKLFRGKWSTEIQIALLSTATCLGGLTMVTRGGVYILNIFNTYSISGWCLYFLAAIEAIAIGWVYDADRMCDDIKLMVGYEVPRLYLKICWKFIVPIVSLILMVYSLVLYEPLKYGRDYVYPVWADVLGWMTALSSMLCPPIVAGTVLWKAEGFSFVEKLRSAVTMKYVSARRKIDCKPRVNSRKDFDDKPLANSHEEYV